MMASSRRNEAEWYVVKPGQSLEMKPLRIWPVSSATGLPYYGGMSRSQWLAVAEIQP